MSQTDEWLVFTRYHTVRGDFRLWWGPDRGGYTVDVDKAGVYTRAEAEDIECTRRCPDGSLGDVAVRRSAVLRGAIRVSSRDGETKPEDVLPDRSEGLAS